MPSGDHQVTCFRQWLYKSYMEIGPAHFHTSSYPIGSTVQLPASSPSRHQPMTFMTIPAPRTNIVPSIFEMPGTTSCPSLLVPKKPPAGVVPYSEA